MIDAAGKSIGRVAATAAKMLMGKTSAAYTPHIFSDVKVMVKNASKLSIRDRKKVQKTFTTYSGYPGGIKRQSLSHLIDKKGNAGAIRQAVRRMLPRNTMLTARLKNLTISE